MLMIAMTRIPSFCEGLTLATPSDGKLQATFSAKPQALRNTLHLFFSSVFCGRCLWWNPHPVIMAVEDCCGLY